MPRRPSIFTFVAASLTTLFFFYYLFAPNTPSHAAGIAQTPRAPAELHDLADYDPAAALAAAPGPAADLASGPPIMGAMDNATIRAEVGRASWKLFHTILAKYPEKPQPQERETLAAFIHLFSRVYPCGQCASHFQDMLRKFPPQTSSRNAASQWGCFVHNQVNERLGKPVFDCNTISDKYACGCADDKTGAEEAAVRAKQEYVQEAEQRRKKKGVADEFKLDVKTQTEPVLEKGG